MGEVNGVHEWEDGLPNVDDITPLSQGLIPRGLLSAFNIKPAPYRTSVDVAQASEMTMSSLRTGGVNFTKLVETEVIGDDDDGDVDDTSEKHRRNVSPEDADSAAAMTVEVAAEEEGDEKAAKRARLVWTPQLHRRFVDVVAHLGINNAVPKTIMQLMNVEGLTRENVASHLQKYRLYLKRNQGINFDSAPQANSSSPSLQPPANSTPDVVPVPVPMAMNYKAHHQNNQQNSYYIYNQCHQYSNGVMQTGNNNMYGGGGGGGGGGGSSVGSYNHNHHLYRLNFHPHVTPGDN